MRYFSREALIIMLREFVEEYGRCPTKKDIGGNSGIPGEHVYRAVFGGFHNALVAAGLKPLRREDSSKAYLVKMLKILAERVGKIPSSADLKKYRDMPSRATYEDQFGTWKDALLFAGFDVAPKADEAKAEKPKKKSARKKKAVSSLQKHYTDEEMLEALRNFVNKHGHRPKSRDLHGELPSDRTYRDRFGSLQAALEKAGCGDAPRKEVIWKKLYKDEDILQSVREIAAELGRVPSMREALATKKLPATRTIFKRFGSWNGLLAKAGIERETKVAYSRDELVDFLRGLANELKRRPKKADIVALEHGPGLRDFRDEFGSWQNALEVAQIEVIACSFVAPKESKEEQNRQKAIAAVRELAAELGHVPSVCEAEKRKIRPTTRSCYRYFGSWEGTLREAGLI